MLSFAGGNSNPHDTVHDQNPKHEGAWKELTTGGFPEYKENHNAIAVMSDLLKQWLDRS
jgi:hypothetical protein